MKVFVFGTRGFPNIQGGVEKHCECLYPLLAVQFDITVFRRKAFLREGTIKDNASSVRFIDLPSNTVKGFETFFHSFLCTVYCIFKRPDIIHIHNIGPGMFIPLLKLFKLKVVLTYHSPNYEHKKWGFLSKKVLKVSEYLATRWADKIIFVNMERMLSFTESIRRKSVFIPNGVHIKSRSLDTDYIISLGLEPGKYILTVGRITQEKGLDYLINAFLQNHISGYKLVIAGGIDHHSNYATTIRKNIQTHPSIIGTGYVEGENLRQLYSHAALFVLASYNEGFPLVLLEAMNYGLPILASDISANKSLRLRESDYFKVNDATNLAEHISLKLANPQPSCNYDLNAYTWESVSGQIAEVFISLTKSG